MEQKATYTATALPGITVKYEVSIYFSDVKSKIDDKKYRDRFFAIQELAIQDMALKLNNILAKRIDKEINGAQ